MLKVRTRAAFVKLYSLYIYDKTVRTGEPSDLEEVGALRPEILSPVVTTSGVTTTPLLPTASLMLSDLAESLPTSPPAVGCR